mgnify:CR=1 FL=1
MVSGTFDILRISVCQRLEELNGAEGTPGVSSGGNSECLVSHMLAHQGLSNFEVSAMMVELMVGSVETVRLIIHH